MKVIVFGFLLPGVLQFSQIVARSLLKNLLALRSSSPLILPFQPASFPLVFAAELALGKKNYYYILRDKRTERLF